MFSNYLKIAFRDIARHKGFAFINIAGLAVGMASCMLIFMWVQDELRYDRHHEKHDRIYRVTRAFLNEDGSTRMHFGHVAYPIAPLLKQDFPAITQTVRLLDMSATLVMADEKRFEETRFFFAEETVFDVFSFQMIEGRADEALNEPFSVVLTQETARKYFGDDNPTGRTLTVELFDKRVDLTVRGVIASMPEQSHFHPDFLASLKTWDAVTDNDPAVDASIKDWGTNIYPTYILLSENGDAAELKRHLGAFLDRYVPTWMSPTKLRLQRLTDIHLYSHLDSEIEANGDVAYVYFFSITALLILLIACINFMNLATARSARRAREIGLRKVVGAHRSQLIRQFLGESCLMAVLAMGLAVLLVFMMLPSFNQFIQKDLTLDVWSSGPFALGLIVITGVVGLIAGLYPAVFLSGFEPVTVLKGRLGERVGKFSFRTVLVVFQYAVSIVLIIGLGVVTQQLDHLRSVRLGFDKEHVLVLPFDEGLTSRLAALKNQLQAHPDIVTVTAAKHLPSDQLGDNDIAYTIRGDSLERVSFIIAMLRVDHDYIPTFGMSLAAGRNFSKERASDSTQAFILNETAARKLGWASAQEAVGQRFAYFGRRGEIIGVLKDVHFESLHQEIAPMLMLISPYGLQQIAVRIRPGGLPGALAFLRERWQALRPDHPFTYHFLDEKFDQLYASEEKLRQMYGVFAFLAIFIACLGLWGLAAYTAERRTREIGIRKVMGASVSRVVVVLSQDFTRWVLLANVLAWPAAYLLMNRWLEGFASRAAMGWQPFVLAGAGVLLVALLTVSYQALKAALANPIDALKHE